VPEWELAGRMWREWMPEGRTAREGAAAAAGGRIVGPPLAGAEDTAAYTSLDFAAEQAGSYRATELGFGTAFDTATRAGSIASAAARTTAGWSHRLGRLEAEPAAVAAAWRLRRTALWRRSSAS